MKKFIIVIAILFIAGLVIGATVSSEFYYVKAIVDIKKVNNMNEADFPDPVATAVDWWSVDWTTACDGKVTITAKVKSTTIKAVQTELPSHVNKVTVISIIEVTDIVTPTVTPIKVY